MTATTWTVTAVAAKLGLSVPTLRSWERRYGIGPSQRTGGGHRRYSSADVASLQHMQQLIRAGSSTSDAAKRLLLEPDPQALTAAVNRFDQAAIAHHARLLVARYGTEYAWMTEFVPLLREVGERWTRDCTGIAVEHVLTDALLSVLQDNANRHVGDEHPRALLAATSQEMHTLPLYAAASAFAERHVANRVLGRVPGEVVVTMTRQLRPDVVFLWARSSETTELETLRELSTLTTTFAAGPGWPDHLPDGVSSVHDLTATLAAVSRSASSVLQ